jgi:hypothetical protein
MIDHWNGIHVPTHMRTLVLPWVRDCVCDAGQASLRETRRRLTVTERLAVDTLKQGLPLDREIVFDPANVEHIIELWAADEPSAAGTYRSSARRMGPLVTREAPWPPPATPISRLCLPPPYTASERRALERAGRHQSTPTKARVLDVTLGLGLGAGLDGRATPWVTPEHLTWQGGIFCVTVEKPNKRVVPIRKPYWPFLQQIAEDTEAGHYLLSGDATAHHRNYLSERLSSVDLPPGTPPVHAGRLRSTWLVHHLNAGTRIPELLEAAGLRSTTCLWDVVPYVDPQTRTSALTMLSR